MLITGFILTILIGILIGLFGGGGSILTVPVLVYLFAVPAGLATTYSLALVGLTSLFAVAPAVWQKRMAWPKVIAFGLPSMLAMLTVRAYIIPLIPAYINVFGHLLYKDTLTMLAFSVLMLVAGFYMLRQNKATAAMPSKSPSLKVLSAAGIAEGAITGLVGAGGGFIIVPMLLIFGQLPLKQAILNSLLIIGIKSTLGFLASHNLGNISPLLLTQLLAIAFVGMFIGTQLSKRLATKQLKPIFGAFVILMGLLVLLKETLL